MPMPYLAQLSEADRAEEAAGLFGEVADWDGFTDIILKNASSLTAQGKRKTLEQWLFAIPESTATGNPWLLYWRGNCRASENLQEARACLEKALELFGEQDEVEGIYLTWAAIVDTYSLEFEDWRPLDKWLDEFDVITRRYPLLPSPELEIRVAASRFIALVLRQTGPSQIR